MSVILEKIAIVPTGMDSRQMDVLFRLLAHRFQSTFPTQILRPQKGLSEVEMRLQSLPGIDAIIPVGDKESYIAHIHSSSSREKGSVLVAPLSYVDYLVAQLFMGYSMIAEVNVGNAIVGKFGIPDEVQVIPF